MSIANSANTIQPEGVLATRRLIDYEYAGPNPVAYDIANHWCEYAADYHGHEPYLLDYSRFPSKEQQLEFTTAYAAAVRALKPSNQEEVSFPVRYLKACHTCK